MTTTLYVVIALALTVGVLGALTKGRRKRGEFGARQPMTPNEQGMYWRLVEAFPPPTHVVLAQVSFGALLRAKGGASRYSFSQKIADFVLLDKSFKVLAVIELDDSSHRDKKESDNARDAMLTQAGYRVLRYPRTPDAAKLIADISA